jgi:hypothetical protein
MPASLAKLPRRAVATSGHQQVGVRLAADMNAGEEFELTDRSVEGLEAPQAITLLNPPDRIDDVRRADMV